MNDDESIAEAAPVVVAPPAPAPAPAAKNPFALPPVSSENPCGPDLDLEGDSDFLNLFASTEGLLPGKPAAFYAFTRDAIDFPEKIKAIDGLLARTLDLRLLVLGAKLAILNRDLRGFAARVGSVAWALDARWDEAHPRPEGGDLGLRVGQLEMLDDNGCILLPLQYAPLLEAPRLGAMSYRDHLVATGAAQPRVVTRFDAKGNPETVVDETFMAPASIDRLLRDVDIETLREAFELAQRLAESVVAIRTATAERGGGATVRLEKLSGVVTGMAAFLRTALVARDPSLAPPEPEPREAEEAAPGAGGAAAAAAAPSDFATLADIDAALSAAHGYFLAAEPTSPAVLLIRQARLCLGKNLYEVMQLLAPNAADEARVFVGADGAFKIPVRNLADAPTAESQPAEAAPAASRPAAIAIVDQVVRHMQKTQPSSPVPYLLERAKALATRDFIGLLGDLLSEDAAAGLRRRD